MFIIYCIYWHVPPAVTIHHCSFISNAFYFFCSECWALASTIRFLVFPACMRTCSHGCRWALFSYKEQGGLDYSFTLKWWNGSKIPFISYCLFSSPDCSTAVHWFVLTWVFASLVQWNEWHNHSSRASIFFPRRDRKK